MMLDARRGLGSSPHTRGARWLDDEQPHDNGIIPAYAGSTPRVTNYLNLDRDHPRIRGEHRAHRRSLRLGRGSSPHTRGAQSCVKLAFALGGIIPAYAGSTNLLCCAYFPCQTLENSLWWRHRSIHLRRPD